MTSSPGPMPRESKAACRAVVPFETLIANRFLVIRAKLFSKSFMYFPFDDIQEDVRHILTFCHSSLPKVGR